MLWSRFRVNSYREFQLPPKPSFEVCMAKSQLLPTPRRAVNLQNLLRVIEPVDQHRVQKISWSLD